MSISRVTRRFGAVGTAITSFEKRLNRFGFRPKGNQRAEIPALSQTIRRNPERVRERASRCLGRFCPRSQDFRDTPGLSDAAPGHMRLARIKNFADRSNAVIAQVHRERFKKFSSGRTIMRINFQPSVDEGPDQPGPNRTLMISAVARSEIATVNWFIIWIVGRERAQANWRHQFFLDDL